QTLTLTSSMTLYAQWRADAPSSSPPTPSSSPVSELTVSFVTDGGSGSLTTLNDTVGASVVLPSASSVVREGYTLMAWNTEADGKGTSYAPGESIAPSTSLTLYAQWTTSKAAPEVLYGAIGNFAYLSTSLSPSLEQQVRELAAELKAKRYKEVKLYGYTASTGLTSLDKTVSTERASRVASYLRAELRTMKVTGVSIAASGEGSVAGKTSSLYSRVEVFVS
ncbi:MAG TPA: InlB B-repeat-containing protein, partial [Acidimicrobiales bacterium]|nr:InlB B-repeat-containing protein [Acidimicrobiales bacterium]